MKNKINSRSVRMIAVNSRNTTATTNSFATIITTVPTDKKKDYSGINFSKIRDFSNYTFKGANLTGAIFEYLDFEKGEFIEDPNNIEKLTLPTSKLDFLDFSGADLTGASFYGTTMPNTNFQGAICTGASFIDTKMHNAKFQGAICTGASFIDTKMHNAKFQGAIISNLNCDGTDLTGADFSGLTMTSYVSFSYANLEKANFSNTTFTSGNIEFIESNFTDANFSGANIVDHADFTGGIFKNTNFSKAIINGSFEAVDIYRDPERKSITFENVDFTNANLEQTYFNAYNDKQIITLNKVNFTGTTFPTGRDIFIEKDYTYLNGKYVYYKYMSVEFTNTLCPPNVKCKV
jgi:uncharacterized protein YjbI with pentapeptide repeats